MTKQYVKIYCCGDCIQYNWRKHKCNLGAHVEGKPSDSFYQDCPIGLHEEDEILPSAESERTAKVIEHDASITDDRGYKYWRSEYLCEKCKKKVIGGDDYCSHCGCRLEWK